MGSRKKITGVKSVKGLKTGKVSSHKLSSHPEKGKAPPPAKKSKKSVSFAPPDALEVTAKQYQSKMIYGESHKRLEDIAPEGGSRNQIKKVKGLIESLNDFDPTKVVISTMSADYIRKASVTEVTNPEYDPTVEGGVNSSMMGTTNGDSSCVRCAQSFCNGHFGRIELAVPIINKLFFRETAAVVESVCQECSRLLINIESFEYANPIIKRLSGWPRLSRIAKASGSLNCHNSDCPGNIRSMGFLNKKKSRGVNVFYRKATKFQNEYKINTETIVDILSKITPEDAKYLGFNKETKPVDLLFRVLPVIPPISRPPVYAGGTIKEDPLTVYYGEIVSKSNEIRSNPMANEDTEKVLYKLVNKLISGKKKDFGEAKDSLGILQRINGKEGLFRGALQGKRVNYSGRAVLSPSIDIEFGEIGIPEAMARLFHMPVSVTQDNYGFIIELLEAGKIVSYTPYEDGEAKPKINISPNVPVTIKVGDEVERMAIDGDMCVFNRQPTIHHGSLLGYTMRILKEGNTIRLHPSSTTTHNADFDGDAAMVLYPRDPKAIEEVRYLIHTIENLMDDKHGKPLAGIIMDGITSAYLMTSDNEIIHPLLFTSAIDSMKNGKNFDIEGLQDRAKKFGLHPWSGRTLFSALFPEDFTYNNAGIVIYKGILIGGRVKAGAIDSGQRSIIQELWKFYGPQEAANFLTNATRVLLLWLNNYGFSIGSADIDFGNSEEVTAMKKRFLDDINSQIRELGKIPDNKFEQEKFEEKVMAIVDRAYIFGKEIAEKKMKEGVSEVFGHQNAIGIMAKDVGAGAKADLFNVAMIGGSVGQQYYAGERPGAVLPGAGMYQPRPVLELSEEERRNLIEREFDEIGNTLEISITVDDLMELTNSFDKYGMLEVFRELRRGSLTKRKIKEIKKKDRVQNWGRFIATMPLRPTDVEAPVEERGYCVHSFSDGMTPTESFAQAWGTRGDLINTNMMTAVVGDAGRRLNKAMENIKIHDDGTIRSLTGPIYQFSWGHDGLESMFMVQANTAHHGRVQVFCDLESIVERANAQVGLINEKYNSFITANLANAEKYDANFKKELERTKVPVDTGRVYNEKVSSIEEPEIEPSESESSEKEPKKKIHDKKYGIPQIIKRMEQIQVLDSDLYIYDEPQNVEEIQSTSRIVNPSEAFERKRGQKESHIGRKPLGEKEDITE
jgi:DNA-directed RNA polymerase subunit A'